MDVAEELASASIDLTEANLNFELKGIKYAHNEAHLMALMTYNAMGEEYTEQMLNEILNKAYQEHIRSLYVPLTKEVRMKKVVLEVKMTLEYPPHGNFQQYKKGQPRPRHSVKDKRAPCIQYDKRQDDIIKEILPSWKAHTRAVLGTPAHVREIPKDGADVLTIQKFREDFEIHLAVDSCVMYGYLSGVIQLDTAMKN
jgi:hypothetical protein